MRKYQVIRKYIGTQNALMPKEIVWLVYDSWSTNRLKGLCSVS